MRSRVSSPSALEIFSICELSISPFQSTEWKPDRASRQHGHPVDATFYLDGYLSIET
jgi:hypothetical protein